MHHWFALCQHFLGKSPQSPEKQKSQIFYLKVSHLVKFQLLKNEQVAN